jgi:hypothetical protein
MAQRLPMPVGTESEGSVVTTYTLSGGPLRVPRPGTPRTTLIEGESEDGTVHIRFDIDDRLVMYFVYSRDGQERETSVNIQPLRGATRIFITGTWTDNQLTIYAGDKDKADTQAGHLLQGTTQF